MRKTSEPNKEGDTIDSSPPNADILRIYLNQIGTFKLLTREEEIALFKKIKQGDEKARHLMIESNLRLVVKIAFEYENRGASMLDLINEGNIGLMQAVKRFDLGNGAKLSTYAGWWIHQKMQRYLMNHGRTIRIPAHMGTHIYHMTKAITKLSSLLEREPTDAEIAQEMKVSVRRVISYKKAILSTVSLDTPLGEDTDSSLGDMIRDSSIHPIETKLFGTEDKKLLTRLLSCLDKKWTFVIKERYGLNDNNPKTLEQISATLNLTRERVRQIELLAFMKLRKVHRELKARKEI